MKLFKMTHKLGEPFAKDINLATDSTVLVGFNWVDENGDAYNPDEGSLEVNGEAPTIVSVEGVAYTCWNVSAGDAEGTTEYAVTWEKDESPFECTFRVVTADRSVAEVDLVGEEYELPIASDTSLGGVKVGANLSIDEDGVLSAGTGSFKQDLDDGETHFVTQIDPDYLFLGEKTSETETPLYYLDADSTQVTMTDWSADKYLTLTAGDVTVKGTDESDIAFGAKLTKDGIFAFYGEDSFPMAPSWHFRGVDLSALEWEEVDGAYYGGVYVKNGDVLAFENWETLPGYDVNDYYLSVFLFPSEEESDVATTMFGFSQNYDTGAPPSNFQIQIQTSSNESDAVVFNRFQNNGGKTTLNLSYLVKGSQEFSYLFVTKSPFLTTLDEPIYIGNRFDENAPYLAS